MSPILPFFFSPPCPPPFIVSWISSNFHQRATNPSPSEDDKSFNTSIPLGFVVAVCFLDVLDAGLASISAASFCCPDKSSLSISVLSFWNC